VTRNRTLVVHTGGVGDFIVACPALRERARTETLDILGRPVRIALAQHARIAERALDIDRSGFETIFSTPSERLRETLTPYARSLVFMRDEDGAITRAFRACGVLDVQCFPGLPPGDWNAHASDYYADCLGVPRSTEPLRLDLPADPKRHDVLIHPGSGGRAKNWPLENFLELAGKLRNAGRAVAWILGPAELEQPGFAALRATGDPIVENPSLIEIAREIAAANAYLGNDSGITHLAAATSCPNVLALFGPTDPALWAPQGPAVRILSFDRTVQNAFDPEFIKRLSQWMSGA
jgi:heptosyltransferase III